MRPFRKLTATLVLTAAALAVLAALKAPGQQAPAPTIAPATVAPPTLRGPVLTDEQGQPVKGVRLAAADVRAVVHGSLAEATMTLTFANTENRVLGGELVFPLPEGATVTGYGLEVNGAMVDGVAVEKQQARVIYEKELHKRVDPGLVEQAAGNAFRTRLYPVPANGSRSIKVQYVAEVSAGKDGTTLALPMGWGAGVDRCTIHIEVPEAQAEPSLPSVKGQGLAFRKAEHGYAADGQLKEGPQELVIALPALPARWASVEKRLRPTVTPEDLDEQAKGGEAAKKFTSFEHYFLVSDTPPAAEAAAQPAAPTRPVRRVGVLWDAGLGRAEGDKARELKLLDAVLRQWKDATGELVVFRDTAEAPVHFDLRSADGRGQVIEQLSHVVYDGASDLAHLPLPKNLSGFAGAVVDQPVADYDCLLLFTDGLGTVGGIGTGAMQKAAVPVYAFSDEQKVNFALLRQVCRDSGGAYFNLKRAGDEEVLSAVGREPYALVSVDYKPEQVAEVYPPAGGAVGGRVTVCGRLLAPEATITLNYGHGKTVTHSQNFTLKASEAGVGDLLPRYWAQQKVAELALRPGDNREELEAVGKRFNLVTPSTSLLVLETAEQYVQYRVVPPKSQPEVYKQFLARIEQNKAQERQTKEQKLQQVLAWWDGRVKWWEQEYKYPKDFKVKGGGEGEGFTFVANPVPASGRPATSPAAAPGLAPVAESAVAEAPPGPHGPVFGSGGSARRPPASPAPRPAAAADAAPTVASTPATPAADGQPAGNTPSTLGPSTGVPGSIGRQSVSQTSRDNIYARGVEGQRGVALQSEAQFDAYLLADHLADPSRLGASGAAIAIKPWDPAAPYLSAMKAAGPEKAYAVFLGQRKSYGSSPAFYLEAGDLLERMGQHRLAVRVLSDVAALRLADARLLRVAARRLLQAGERQRAIELLEAVLKMRPEEPQSHRDLALALSDRADALAALPKGDPSRDSGRMASDYARCLSLLNEVIVGRWDRFQEIELPCLMEANRVIARVKRLQQAGEVGDVPVPLDPRLVKDLQCDLRVAMEWDADSTDIDLWVTEPSGEKCFYGHNRTAIGGLLSRDFTDGYGPEEYCLRRLMPGRYTVQANFYGSRQQELTGPATVSATVFTDFGRASERKQTLTLRLDQAKQVVDIGSVTLGEAEPKIQSATDGAKRVYTVHPGDTLSGIARKLYGDANQWKRIADANPGLEPDKLQPGQTIVLP